MTKSKPIVKGLRSPIPPQASQKIQNSVYFGIEPRYHQTLNLGTSDGISSSNSSLESYYPDHKDMIENGEAEDLV